MDVLFQGGILARKYLSTDLLYPAVMCRTEKFCFKYFNYICLYIYLFIYKDFFFPVLWFKETHTVNWLCASIPMHSIHSYL